MICRERVAELVECARRSGTLPPDLRAHIAGCSECAERWSAERELSSYMRAMANRAAVSFDEDRPLAYAHRESLMREFAWRHRRSPARFWALAAAAGLLLAIGLGHEMGGWMRSPALRPAAHSAVHSSDRPATVFFEASADAGSLSSDDFIAVPYAPPLATGELVTVVRADMDPAELASMGFEIDPASSDVSTDVVMGQDGFPRAVRIAESSQF